MEIEIPSHLARNLRTHHGVAVDAWLKTIPALITRLEKSWDFTAQSCLLGGVASVLLRGALPGNQPAILKIPFEQELVLWEAAALEHWQGRGCSPKLLALDKKALLLGYIGGSPLTGSAFVEIDKLVELLNCLHQSPQPKNITVPDLQSNWLDRLDLLESRLKDKIDNQFSKEIKFARELSANLTQTTKEKVLLHGDLHLGNILQDSNGKLHAIDPKPRIGDRGWDIAYTTLSAQKVIDQQKMLVELATAANYPLNRASRWQWVLAFDDVISKWHVGNGSLDRLKEYQLN